MSYVHRSHDSVDGTGQSVEDFYGNPSPWAEETVRY